MSNPDGNALDDDPGQARDPGGAEEPTRAPRRRRWQPEAGLETPAALRRLAGRPWLIAGRDDEDIAAVRRNLPAIRDALARLGWVLIVERSFVRLRKSPPARRDAWSSDAPSPLVASWFFLLVAGGESLAPRVSLAQLVSAARSAAAEAGLPLTHDLDERRAIVRALRMLDERGVITQLDGDAEEFVANEEAPVLLAVHHARLAHVIAHFGASDPTKEPEKWLAEVEREPDPARRMRRRLIDDTVVHVDELDAAEAEWLSRRLRADDGGPLAAAFGLSVERRSEGAALVVPSDAFRHLHELGPTPFPAAGTVPHAALLLIEHASLEGLAGAPEAAMGIGWRGLPQSRVAAYIASLAAQRADGKGGWRRELTEEPRRLVEEIAALLSSLGLLRVRGDEDADPTWWLSPATARWAPPRRKDAAVG
jgi:uncharacterized protein (TIGR02678 family)